MESGFKDDSAIFINSYTHYVFTKFLTNILDVKKIERKFPDFYNHFKRDALLRKEREFLEDLLVKEMSNLLIKM